VTGQKLIVTLALHFSNNVDAALSPRINDSIRLDLGEFGGFPFSWHEGSFSRLRDMPDDDPQGANANAGPRFRLAVPVFNGARDNVKVVSYLTKAQLWVTASGTPDAEAASALIFAMTGDAEIFGLNLVNKEEAAAKSWTELKKKIREVFLVDLTSAERKKIRMQMKQEPVGNNL